MSDKHALPRGPVRRVGVVAKSKLQEAAGLLDGIASWLAERGVEPVFDDETAALLGGAPPGDTCSRDELPAQADLLLVLGGDGTLISMAGRVAAADRDIPILGVNFGSLGFLTEIRLDELYPALEAAIAGTAPNEPRLMLLARAERDGRTILERPVLNEIVVTKGALSRMIDLAVSVDGEFVAHFKADGLIVASPTGSTAYNLAAGGPIVHPTVDAILLTPIAPHTLTNRPVVIPATAEIEITPRRNGATDELFVTFDGQRGCDLSSEDRVVVRRAARPVHLVKASSRGYFAVLRQKLKWAER